MDGGEGGEGTVGGREGVLWLGLNGGGKSLVGDPQFCQVIRIDVNFNGYRCISSLCISFRYGCW